MRLTKLTLYSYAKVNLYLSVIDKRKDAFHDIKTIFERVDLHDTISLSLRKDDKIKLTHNCKDLPNDSSNLAVRSAVLLNKRLKSKKGVNIRLTKRIPIGSGLGGGSSNAACVLAGLNKLWRLNLSQKQLLSYAAELGSDVPFFIADVSFAQGDKRGDVITPLNNLSKVSFWHILVVPKIKVSTPLIYKKWDTLKILKLTKLKDNVKILNSAFKQDNLSLAGKALFNGLEQATIPLYPAVGAIKDRLNELGVPAVLMSGSGPAVFGIVSSRKEAVGLSQQLKKENKTYQVFVAKTR